MANVGVHLSQVLHLFVQQFQHPIGQHVHLVCHTRQTLGRVPLRILQGLRALPRLEVVPLAVGRQLVEVLVAVSQLFPGLGDPLLEQLRHLHTQLVLRHLCVCEREGCEEHAPISYACASNSAMTCISTPKSALILADSSLLRGLLYPSPGRLPSVLPHAVPLIPGLLQP